MREASRDSRVAWLSVRRVSRAARVAFLTVEEGVPEVSGDSPHREESLPRCSGGSPHDEERLPGRVEMLLNSEEGVPRCSGRSYRRDGSDPGSCYSPRSREVPESPASCHGFASGTPCSWQPPAKRDLRPFVRSLQRRHVELFHRHHGFHHSLHLPGVPVADEIDEAPRDDLP